MTENIFNGYKLGDNPEEMDPEAICSLLHHSYWAADRPREVILKSMENSLCFGAWKDGKQVAFARVVTDFATIFWLGDLIVDEAHRGHGLGKAFVEFILSSERLRGLNAILTTRDAHSLYEKFGFVKIDGLAMGRRARSS